MQRLLTTATLVGLLVATAAAFAVTERLKLTKSPIFGTVVYPKTGFSPTCGCARGRATIRFKLRHPDAVSVRILDSHKSTVRVVVDGVQAARGLNVFKWDGRTDGNVIAKDGRYSAEIHLAGQHRTIILPNPIQLDTTAPVVKSVTTNRDAFSPDGDHQADFVRIHYELSKSAHVNLYLDGAAHPAHEPPSRDRQLLLVRHGEREGAPAGRRTRSRSAPSTPPATARRSPSAQRIRVRDPLHRAREQAHRRAGRRAVLDRRLDRRDALHVEARPAEVVRHRAGAAL